MKHFSIKLNSKQTIQISEQVFIDLLDISYVKEYKDYVNAVEAKQITFENLKKLAAKAGVPYPLFFAPQHIVDLQIRDKDKNLYEKIPSKEEMKLSSRGRFGIKDIELIVKDLGRKQEFLKNRVLPTAKVNSFIGSVASKVKSGSEINEIATTIRNYLEIDLNYLRTISKERVLNYITGCAEKKGILISFSSYNYMPQNIEPELELSGICIKDKKFPYIFINTRDGDSKPKIIESTGRQIFTLLSMLACVAMGRFILSSKLGPSKTNSSKMALAIAAEILIPKSHLAGIRVTSLDELKERAHAFRVTPSMLLYQLKDSKKIDSHLATSFRLQLQNEVKKAEPQKRHAPLPINAYKKYNGDRFSKEIIRAYNNGAISQVEIKNILFRKGKMDTALLNDYSQKFK